VLPLCERLEEHWFCVFLRMGILCVRHHTDDLIGPYIFVFVDSEVAADGILIGEKLSGEGLIDQGNQGRVVVVVLIE